MVNLVAEDEEGDFGELLEAEELVERVFGFGEAVDVFGVDEVHDAVYFREILRGVYVISDFASKDWMGLGMGHVRRAISCGLGDGRRGQRL